jgi:hypothetical protein
MLAAARNLQKIATEMYARAHLSKGPQRTKFKQGAAAVGSSSLIATATSRSATASSRSTAGAGIHPGQTMEQCNVDR